MSSSGGVKLNEEIVKLKQVGVKIHPVVWDVLYMYLSDYLSVINLYCDYYLKGNESMSIEDAKIVQDYNRRAGRIVGTILHPEIIKPEETQLQKVKDEARKLTLDMKELINHFVNNDLHRIELIIDDSIDYVDPKPVCVDYVKRIHDASSCIIKVLEALRVELQEKDVGF